MIKNKTYCHIVKHQKRYLLLLAIIISSLPALFNISDGSPLFNGTESYYYLSLLPEPIQGFPLEIALLFPVLILTISVLLYYSLAKRLNIGTTNRFYYLLLFILSPIFISSYSILSGYAIALLLMLSGCKLLFMEKKIKYVSIIPFIAATFIDGFTSVLLLFVLLIILFNNPHKKLVTTMIGVSFLSFLINILFFHQQFFLGPFHHPKILADLISDLGGFSGVSLFILLLTVIGLSLTWKKKADSWAYLFLIPLIPAYFLSTETMFYFSLVVIFFATAGLRYLLERRWAVPFLKQFTILLLFLSLLFSTITYIERTLHQEPTAIDQEMLIWIKEYTNDEDVIFSNPEYGPYITYFTQRSPFYSLPDNNAQKAGDAATILNSTYIKDTFPILEENSVSIIYITPKMKESLPEDQGLLFLFKNEKFKLLLQREGYEIWEFRQEK